MLVALYVADSIHVYLIVFCLLFCQCSVYVLIRMHSFMCMFWSSLIASRSIAIFLQCIFHWFVFHSCYSCFHIVFQFCSSFSCDVFLLIVVDSFVPCCCFPFTITCYSHLCLSLCFNHLAGQGLLWPKHLVSIPS